MTGENWGKVGMFESFDRTQEHYDAHPKYITLNILQSQSLQSLASVVHKSALGWEYFALADRIY
jgi:hypothetical protein